MPKLADTLLAPSMIGTAPQRYHCAGALLAMWMAKFGGRNPLELLADLPDFCAKLSKEELKALAMSVARHDLASLQLACEVVASMSHQMKLSTLDLMCAIAIDDGYLTISEHEFLLFLAPLLGFLPNELERIFQELSKGCPLPELPRLDDISWWQMREGSGQDSEDDADDEVPPRHDRNTRLHDLGLLGLDEDATDAEIRRAYVRLAQIHHPDKYQVLGEEAMREAEVSFSRIKAAYERLTNA